MVKKPRTMLYGDEGTIHRTTCLNVELDRKGKVVSVWFRCLHLPFTQRVVDDDRAVEMRRLYASPEPPPALYAVKVEDPRPEVVQTSVRGDELGAWRLNALDAWRDFLRFLAHVDPAQAVDLEQNPPAFVVELRRHIHLTQEDG